jgi:caffeoyl-CoA O-methyltransferase
MEPTNEQLLERIDSYIETLFISPRGFSDALAQCLSDAAAAGLPPIQVSPNEGKLLYSVAKLARAARVLEIGTLGGYSSIWLARALPAHGSLVTLEIDSRYAEVARASVNRAGFGDIVEIRVGAANESLLGLIRSGVEPFDLIFIDADKSSYVEYLDLSLQLSHPGTVILADNVIRGGAVLEDVCVDANDSGAKAYNEAIARHPRLDSLILPILRARVDGIAMSIVR